MNETMLRSGVALYKMKDGRKFYYCMVGWGMPVNIKTLHVVHKTRTQAEQYLKRFLKKCEVLNGLG
jgi:hypothetical protein